MPTGNAQSATVADAPSILQAANCLTTAQNPDRRKELAKSLLVATKSYCEGPVDLETLIVSGEAFICALNADAMRGQETESLRSTVHEFIDLARLRKVRRNSYPADSNTTGGKWLACIIKLAEKSHYTAGHMLRQRADQYTHKPLFLVPHGGEVRQHSFGDVREFTEQIARGIYSLLGDSPVTALFTPNRVEGALVDLACLSYGILEAVIPANAIASQLEHILYESGARLVVVSGSEQFRMAETAMSRVASLEWLVSLDPLTVAPGSRVITLDQLVEFGETVASQLLDVRSEMVRVTDVATTMYTSGTTGAPKGIKFSHLNMVSKRIARAAALPEIGDDELFLCYLPLYHTFGRFLEMLGAVHLGATYIFAEDSSTETLIRHMERLRPTAMISVPKKWVDLHRRAISAEEALTDPAAAGRALERITGGRLRWGLSAAGRLDPMVFRFFNKHGIDLLSGYGMTEATGGITMNPPGQYREDTIGRLLPGIECRLGEDDELQLRGPYISAGYSDPQDDLAAFQDGWFCTGDIVQRDHDGFFKHVDRKKDIYKNAGGRTIAPQRVESLFADFPEVARVFAVGDGRDFVTLLIRPNVESMHGSFQQMPQDALDEYFRELVVSCNRFLAPFERVVNFALIDRDFSADHGELTPKGSFRRSVVEENFRAVIEPMYAYSSIERVVDGIRVKIPATFLQHLGATETGVQADQDDLAFLAIHKTLRIRRDPMLADRVWVGNCCYDAVGKSIDLDHWLRLPKLWVGNAELTDITGPNVLLWSVSGDEQATTTRMVAIEPASVSVDGWWKRLDHGENAVPDTLTIHAAALALSNAPTELALYGVDVLAHAMRTGRVRFQELAEWQLQLASTNSDRAVRSRAFAALVEQQRGDSFNKTAAAFCGSMLDFLDEPTCRRIGELSLTCDQWRQFTRALASVRASVSAGGTERSVHFAIQILRSLVRVAEFAPDSFHPVRREVTAWMLAPVPEAVRSTALQLNDELAAAFRRRLGEKERVANDPDSGQPYTWGETIQFEDGIDPVEADRIAGALQHTEVVREAVFLLHRSRLIDLKDLAPGGIWIGPLGTRFGRSVYHVGVRLRNRERCDFTLLLRSTAPLEAFLTDLRLMCVAADALDETPLTPQLGGYWPEYDLATVERISGESVESVIRFLGDHPNRHLRQELLDYWHHLSWSALVAAFEFNRRTEGRWMLAGTVARDISVPLEDFVESTRIFPEAGWRNFEGSLEMILRLKHAFLDRIRFHYPVLAPHTSTEVLYAAVVEAFGLRDGLTFLADAITRAEAIHAPSAETEKIAREMKAYVELVQREGYMPRSLFFAIARYHTWARQVPDAGLHARAAQLRQLQHNYRIEAAARKFPGSRLWLYAETVLKDSPTEGKDTIRRAIVSLRDGKSIKEVLGKLHADLQMKLPSQEHQYFLTRAAYPHLEVDEKAQLVTTLEVGADRAELVTQHTDEFGREVHIRPAANSREVDTLQRIFYAGGIGGGLTAYDQFLVVVDQGGYVIGGAGFTRRTPAHTLLDKIAVLSRCRGRGIGRILVLEFLRRQKAEGVAVVSAEFIRASWLSQFGFRSHPRYAGVVLTLGSDK